MLYRMLGDDASFEKTRAGWAGPLCLAHRTHWVSPSSHSDLSIGSRTPHAPEGGLLRLREADGLPEATQPAKAEPLAPILVFSPGAQGSGALS